jgi:protein arginine kinase activator
MQCEICQEGPASVYVTDLVYTPEVPAGELGKLHTRSICSNCAAELGLPHAQSPSQNKAVLFKLLQKTARRSKKAAGPACASCGMSLQEFRAQGRLGCAACYKVFRAHLEPLLLRMHQANKHTGRGPGIAPAELDLRERISALQERMHVAIREEAYEDAAKLRDELEKLEAQADK